MSKTSKTSKTSLCCTATSWKEAYELSTSLSRDTRMSLHTLGSKLPRHMADKVAAAYAAIAALHTAIEDAVVNEDFMSHAIDAEVKS